MKTEQRKLSDLVSDPNNVRTHSPKNIEAIKGSLAKFGQQKPIVIDEKNIIIAGNGTFEAAKALKWPHLDVVVTTLTGYEKTAFALADNRTAELADWSDELDKALAELSKEIDMTAFGFDFEVKDESKDAIEDDVPEVEQNIHGVKLGDIYQLGNHRLMCGDSTSKEQVEKLMNGEKADMVFTDPPYGISLVTDNRKTSGSMKNASRTEYRDDLKVNQFKKIEGDDKEFDPSFLLTIPCKELFIWGGNNFSTRLPKGGWVCWDRKLTESADRSLSSDFELCWSKDIHKFSMVRITWHGPFGHGKKDDGDKKVHPSQKPVKLAETFFDKWGKDCASILDLYLGSGSTLIACEKTNRKCYGMEIDPHYCSVIIERWQKYSGKVAVKL